MRPVARLVVLVGLLATRGARAQDAAPAPKNADDSASTSETTAPVGEATPARPSSVPPPTYSASDAPHATVPDEQPQRRWYGWQTLLADSTALGLLGLAAANRDNVPLLGASGVVYAAGGPAIHLAHHRVGAFAGSLALRVWLPLVGAGIGLAAASCSGQSSGDGTGACALTGSVYGFIGGAGVAMVVDMALLSWEPTTKSEAPVRPPAVAWSVAPTMDPKSGSKGVAMVGTF